MTFPTWLAFFFAVCAITISPGPGAVLAMAHGLAYGLRRTTFTILGLQAGLLLLLFVAGAGIGSVLVASEAAFNAIKIVGAFYLVYLGIGQWRETSGGQAAMSGEGGHSPPPRWTQFLRGFLTNRTNPKGVVFMVAVLPQFIAAEAPLMPQLTILAATFCMVDLVVMHCYAAAASSMKNRFSSAKAKKRQNRFFGAVLIGIGMMLLFFKRAHVT